MLDGFVKYSPTRKILAVSVTDKSLIFSSNVVNLFGRNAHVSFWIDRKSKRFAIQKENKRDKDTLIVFSGKYQSGYVRISSRVVMSAVKKFMPQWTLETNVYKARGTYDDANNAIIFDFLNAEEREKHGRNSTRQD